MNILIVDNGSSYLSKLVDLCSPHKIYVKSYDDLPSISSADFDLVILSGGHRVPVLGNDDAYKQELNLIRTSEAPILGICLGFELIAHCFGAEMKQMPSKEKTILSIKKVVDDPIFYNLGELKVFENHRYVVTNVGNELTPLATSKDGIEIFKHNQKTIYGFQFHPEMFEDSTTGDELFANFMKIVQNIQV